MKKISTLILLLILTLNTPVFAYEVAFNTKTKKYHQLWCQWARKCTTNCIIIKKEKAIQKGGIPCKVCGG
jgi:hypothetical protein